MVKSLKHEKLMAFYVLMLALAIAALLHPEQIENIARAFVLFLGVS